MRDRMKLLQANVEYPWTRIFTERIVMPGFISHVMGEMRLGINLRKLQTNSRLVRRLIFTHKFQPSNTVSPADVRDNPSHLKAMKEVEGITQSLIAGSSWTPIPARDTQLGAERKRNWRRQLEFLKSSAEARRATLQDQTNKVDPSGLVIEITTELRENGFAIDEGVLPSMRASLSMLLIPRHKSCVMLSSRQQARWYGSARMAQIIWALCIEI